MTSRSASLLWGCLCLAAPLAAQTAQTIQFLPIADRPVTSAPFQVIALSSAYLPVTLSIAGPAQLNGRVLTLTGTGTVTATAKQAGNSRYAPASASLSFQSELEVPALTISPGAPAGIIYGQAFDPATLGIHAAASPMPAYAADAAVITSNQVSAIAPSGPLTYLANDPAIRYEGGTISPSGDTHAVGGYGMFNYPAPYSGYLRMAFTCDCSEVEVKLQGRGGLGYRVWVDGDWTTADSIGDSTPYPNAAYVLIKFPNRTPRQVKVGISANAPIFGINTLPGESISAPQVPVGKTVLLLGDSWTGPTILPPAIGPAQPGITGGGYPEALGEYFNWNYWYDGIGGTGFTNTGTDLNHRVWSGRAQTDICPNPIDGVFILGSTNDGNGNYSGTESGVEDTLAAIQACKPSDPIYFFGVQQDQPINEQAQAAAVAAEGKNVTYFNDGALNWFYGNSTDASTGNNYAFLNGHPTPEGHDFLAEELAAHLVAQVPSLAPKPYPLFKAAPLAGSVQASPTGGELLGAGPHSVAATFTPADAAHYAAASLQATIAVSKATVTITSLTVTAGTTSNETFTLRPQIAGMPTGTLQILLNGAPINAVPLVRGQASISFPSSYLALAKQFRAALTVQYSGDANFLPSSAVFTSPTDDVRACSQLLGCTSKTRAWVPSRYCSSHAAMLYKSSRHVSSCGRPRCTGVRIQDAAPCVRRLLQPAR